MYHKIVNPKTGRKVNIHSSLGRNILMNYLNNIDQHAGVKRKRKSNKVSTDSVDYKMRGAYSKWNNYCRKFNLALTPAYDVVGLIAALGINDVFNEPSEGPEEMVRSQSILLKSSVSQNNNSLADIFKTIILNAEQEHSEMKYSHESFHKNDMESIVGGDKPNNLIIITDFGEECDDETTCLIAYLLRRVMDINVTIIFTNPNFESEVSKLERWVHEYERDHPIPDHLHDLSQGSFRCVPLDTIGRDFELSQFLEPKAKNTILQIGPIHTKNNNAGLRALQSIERLSQKPSNVKYQYILLGEYGKTLNSKADSAEAPRKLSSFAENSIVVNTARGAGSFKFTYNAMKQLFGENNSIIDHVIKIGWRNTIGRANPFAAKFVSHLVADTANAANYQTVKDVVEGLESSGVEGDELSSDDIHKAERLACEYVTKLQTTGPPPLRLVVNSDGSTNSIAGVTVDQILRGYVFILTSMKSYFGVPIEFFESGQPEKWQKQWLYPAPSDRKKAIKNQSTFKVTIPVPSTCPKIQCADSEEEEKTTCCDKYLR